MTFLHLGLTEAKSAENGCQNPIADPQLWKAGGQLTLLTPQDRRLCPDQWPPNSPDLDRVDYKIRGVIYRAACLPDTGSQRRWTETASVARLAWHRTMHHWQCNWRMARASSSLRAVQRRTFWAAVVTVLITLESGTFQLVSNPNVSGF